MNQDKILTIGIPAYNMEELLPRCLDSVVSARNIDKLDIIVVNDGSKDRTLEIAKEYEARYLQSVRVIDKPNGGWGTAINRTISEAQGKYYKSLDSDDWFITENLDSFVERLQNIEADLVLTDFNEVNTEGMIRHINILGSSDKNVLLFDHLESVGHDAYSIHAVTYRTSLLHSMEFQVAPKFYADLDYLLYPLLKVKSVYVIHENIYQYFLGREGQSISTEGYNKHYEDYLYITKKLIPLIETSRAISPSLLKAYFIRIKSVAIDAYRILMMNRYQRKNPESKRLLKELDNYVKSQSSELYSEIGKKKGFGMIPYIRLWRLTGINIFSIICI